MSGQWINDSNEQSDDDVKHYGLVDYLNTYGIIFASIHVGMNCGGILGGILAFVGFSLIEAIVTLSCMSKDELSSIMSSKVLGNEREQKDKLKTLMSKYLPQATCALFIAYLAVRMLLKF